MTPVLVDTHVFVWALAAPARVPDPFDRMLVAQARVEGFALLSFDAALDAYTVRRAP